MTKHIMVVDDSKTIRNLVAFVLKSEGFKVSTAEDGLDAIEKLYSLAPVDLIVSDVNMPRMDGFTFIKTIRMQDYRAFHRRAGAGHPDRHESGRQSVHGQTSPAGKNGSKYKDASWLADKESSMRSLWGITGFSAKRRYGYEPGIF